MAMMKICSTALVRFITAACIFGSTTCLFAQQKAANGAQLFASACGACHGSDGRSGERAPNIATRREIVALSDADLIRIVQHGVAGTGMPAFGYLGDEKIEAIVAHLRTLQGVGVAVHLRGDPALGEKIFFGNGACGSCHMVSGRGGFLAVDLSGYSSGHSEEDLRGSILHPGGHASHEAAAVRVVMKSGEQVEGVLRSQDNFSLVLQLRDGTYRLVRRNQMLRTEPDPSMMMPTDYASRLSSKELDDLVSYLLQSKAVATEREVR